MHSPFSLQFIIVPCSSFSPQSSAIPSVYPLAYGLLSSISKIQYSAIQWKLLFLSTPKWTSFFPTFYLEKKIAQGNTTCNSNTKTLYIQPTTEYFHFPTNISIFFSLLQLLHRYWRSYVVCRFKVFVS